MTGIAGAVAAVAAANELAERRESEFFGALLDHAIGQAAGRDRLADGA